ncbi:gamma-butyrolactone-binding regulator SlbR, partial [Streptomyces sp. SID5926]|nr:gamma-butyrolactone-binding regulator SlbR [Streptomyces sp. SID5926]
MSESTMQSATELASQYSVQVTDDLERNVKEQERVSTEITALQQQLAALQHDHALLVNMQQALGITPQPAQTAPESASSTG